MSPHTRLQRLVLALVFLAGAHWTGLKLTQTSGTFTPFVSQSLPQRALGDFDGDGRQDTALVQDGVDGPHVSVRLSGSADAIRFEGTVIGVVEGDIDHDGDLDLVAATSSGGVLIWLNDGHGRFTPQQASHAPGLSSESALVDTLLSEPIVLGMAVPLVLPRNRADTSVIAIQIRPPSGPLAFDFTFLLPSSPRAPPAPLT
jgi:hypothetical protein